jgi:hypothetical protein
MEQNRQRRQRGGTTFQQTIHAGNVPLGRAIGEIKKVAAAPNGVSEHCS